MMPDRAQTSLPLDTDFDVAFADRIARLEAYNKHYYRPNSYLHKWWARRCGSTFRLILKGLVPDEERRDYYAPGGLEGKVILDPMIGGGTTLHEAIRLGANVIGADLDPIPVLQARATLTGVPPAELEAAYEQLYTGLRQKLEPYFLTTCPHSGRRLPLRYVLYGVRRLSHGREVIVVDSLTLRQEVDGSLIRLCPDCYDILPAGGCSCTPSAELPPLVEKGNSGGRGKRSQFSDDLSLPYWQRYVPLVVVGQVPGRRQLFFKRPDQADRQAIRQADRQRGNLSLKQADFRIEGGRKSQQLLARGINNYLDLFSSRQLLYLESAISLLSHFEPALRLNLALLVSTSLEFNSMLCGYKGKNRRRPGAIRHTFSHHAYSFPHTALENNPLYPSKASGTLQRLYHNRIRNGRRWAEAPRERRFERGQGRFVEIQGERDSGEEIQHYRQLRSGATRQFLLRQGSSARLALPDDSVDFVVTDPPYFDSIQYSDLAAYFRVWLRQFLPGDADWTYDVRQSAVDPHKLDRQSRYLALLSDIFAECHRVLRKDNGRFVFTFHHWNPKGWAALTIALKRAGFWLVNRYVVYSESPISVHVVGMKALLHDAILVLAPNAAAAAATWSKPAAVCRDESEQFCRDCGSLLGWLLDGDHSEERIRQAWREALGQVP